jgi:predicted SpoU family rRNA methylase
MKIKCLRCGQCCYFTDFSSNPIPCKYLDGWRGNKTKCRIFGRHLGAVMGEINVGNKHLLAICGERKLSFHDYQNCPYNTNKPFPPWLIPPSHKEVKV